MAKFRNLGASASHIHARRLNGPIKQSGVWPALCGFDFCKDGALVATQPTQEKRREPNGPRLPPFNYLAYFLHPEQDSQQSAEAQHIWLAAFTAPANVSAISATNSIARTFFMNSSPLKNQVGFCQPMAVPSARKESKISRADF